MERIIEIKGYLGETAFKLAVLKLKKYASLYYENLEGDQSFGRQIQDKNFG